MKTTEPLKLPPALRQHLKGERRGFSISGLGTHVDWVIVLVIIFLTTLGAVFHAWRLFAYVSNREFTVEQVPQESEFDPKKFDQLLKVIREKSGN